MGLLFAIAVGVVGVVVVICIQSRETLSHSEFVDKYEITREKEGRLIAFHRTDVLVIVACALFAVAFMFVLTDKATEWNELRVSQMPMTVSCILPSWPFYLSGVLLGYGIAHTCRYAGYRLFLGKEFFFLWRKQYEVDATIPLHRLVAVVGGIGFVAGPPILFLGLDNYVRLTDESLAVSRFSSVGEEVCSLAHIVKIEESEYEYDDKQYPRYRIEFRDGSEWHSEGIVTIPAKAEEKKQFVKTIAHEAGVRISRFDE